MSVSTPSVPEGASPSATPSTAEATATAASPGSPAPQSAPTAAEHGSQGLYAIVEAGGQQVWLQPGRYLDLNRLDAVEDSTITLDTVLLVKDSKGTTLGQPYVQGATVELSVMAHRRGPKILVYKMRKKKKTRRKTGHRQELTRVMVEAIRVGGQAVA
ncbi:MAG: hypothetical protein RLZZ117_1481 [Cyanobacteriota bacterium]